MPYGVVGDSSLGGLEQAELSNRASKLADARFGDSPHLKNELLNRLRPSSNVVAAQNALLRHTALYEGREQLGIVGFPAEGGLFESLREVTGLYRSARFMRCGETPRWALKMDCCRSLQ